MANRPKSLSLWITDPATGCWVWQRATNGCGYGVVRRNGKTVCAHRYVYEMLRGAIPDGLHLDHVKERCCNTMCVNPDHLEPVTNAENTRRGKTAKITQEQADEIRSSKESSALLARRFGVTRTHVRHIRAGKRRCCAVKT